MKNKLVLLVAISLPSFAAVPMTALADHHVSKTPPFWIAPLAPPAGMTKLVRSKNGVTAQFKTDGLAAGHAVTLWVMFFNNPEYCADAVCALEPYDIFNPDVGFDFHYAGGHIVSDKATTLTGYVRAGERSTSGWAELSALDPNVAPFVTALMNPMGAQVILAIHSHGPAQNGKTLAAQMSSYLGGCAVLLGPGGFAVTPDLIPDEVGECSTIQLAFHIPQP